MEKFRVGDWVRHTFNIYPGDNNFEVKEELLQIAIVEYDIFVTTKGPEFYTSDTNIELWQPQKNEYCWFIDGAKVVLVKFIGFSASFYHGISLQNNDNVCSKICEPFIGELPTILKEK